MTSAAFVGNRTGVYAPRTAMGTLAVFNSKDAKLPVLASSYSTVNDPSLAHRYFNARESVFPPQEIRDDSVLGEDIVTENLVRVSRQALTHYFRGSSKVEPPRRRK